MMSLAGIPTAIISSGHHSQTRRSLTDNDLIPGLILVLIPAVLIDILFMKIETQPDFCILSY